MHILLHGTGIIVIAIEILIAVIASNQARGVTVIEKLQECVEPMKVDYPAPAIQLTDLAGSTVSLVSHKGDVILLTK
jgi:hypothetical protein